MTRFRRVCASDRRRPQRVRLGVAIGRCNSACLEHVASRVRMGLSRGRRGEWGRMCVCVSQEHGGRALRVAGVGLQMHVGAWEVHVAGVRNRAF